jgi:hypothetical protein
LWENGGISLAQTGLLSPIYTEPELPSSFNIPATRAISQYVDVFQWSPSKSELQVCYYNNIAKTGKPVPAIIRMQRQAEYYLTLAVVGKETLTQKFLFQIVIDKEGKLTFRHVESKYVH